MVSKESINLPVLARVQPTPEPAPNWGEAVIRALQATGRGLATAVQVVDEDVRRELVHLPLMAATALGPRRRPVKPLPDDGHRPVVFVHGLAGHPGNFRPMARHFRQGGRRRLYGAALPLGKPAVWQAEYLRDFVAEVLITNDLHDHQVDIVAHSRGGIVTRLALDDVDTARRVATLVTVGTPHRGTVAARYGRGMQLDELRPESDVVAHLHRQLPWTGPRLVCLYSGADPLVVPSTYAQVPGATNIELPGLSHCQLLLWPVGWETALAALSEDFEMTTESVDTPDMNDTPQPPPAKKQRKAKAKAKAKASQDSPISQADAEAALAVAEAKAAERARKKEEADAKKAAAKKAADEKKAAAKAEADAKKAEAKAEADAKKAEAKAEADAAKAAAKADADAAKAAAEAKKAEAKAAAKAAADEKKAQARAAAEAKKAERERKKAEARAAADEKKAARERQKAEAKAKDDPKWRRRKDARPDELVAAALQLFAEQGFAKTNLRDVGKKAGVSKATVYLYFKNKEDLLVAAVQRSVVPILDFADDYEIDTDAPAGEMIRTLVHKWVDEFESRKVAGLPKLVAAEASNFPALGQVYVDAVLNRARRLFQRILKRGVRDGEFKAIDVRVSVHLLLAPVLQAQIHTASLGSHDPGFPEIHAFLDAHLDQFLGSIKA